MATQSSDHSSTQHPSAPCSSHTHSSIDGMEHPGVPWSAQQLPTDGHCTLHCSAASAEQAASHSTAQQISPPASMQTHASITGWPQPGVGESSQQSAAKPQSAPHSSDSEAHSESQVPSIAQQKPSLAQTHASTSLSSHPGSGWTSQQLCSAGSPVSSLPTPVVVVGGGEAVDSDPSVVWVASPVPVPRGDGFAVVPPSEDDGLEDDPGPVVEVVCPPSPVAAAVSSAPAWNSGLGRAQPATVVAANTATATDAHNPNRPTSTGYNTVARHIAAFSATCSASAVMRKRERVMR